MSRKELTDIPREMAFPRAEYARRIEKTRAAMDGPGLDLMLVHSLPDICYLTGFQTPLSDWYHCLILPRDGVPVLQVCDPELAAMHSYIDTVLPVAWDSMDSAPAQLTDYLRSIGVEHWRIGVQRRRPGLNPDTETCLRVALPSAHVIDASDLVPALRAVKSEAEIAALRTAARLSTLGMEAAVSSIHSGNSENEVAGAAAQAIIAAGGEYFAIEPIVRAGRRSGVTHATPKRSLIQAGDPVLMEIGGVFKRYCAPLLRTAVVGPPSARLRQLADTSLAAMDRLFDHLRPGVTAGEIASAAMGSLDGHDAAFKSRGYFGYSVGIGFPPSWVERSIEIAVGRGDVLLPGMVFHTHRALRIPGVMGVGFSESVLITETGYELLTAHPRQLIVL
jgi:Xaa-Pro aminopeptidase